MARVALALPLVCLGLTGCVAPLLLAPTMIPAMMSSAAPAMGMATASAAARTAATRAGDGTYAQRPPPKFEPPWAVKKKAETAESAQ
ncbi:MAG: hypothetical protein ACKOKC_05350 [Chthoniobacterales bacterium]